MDYITKEDLRLAIAPLATREEMQAAFAKVPTREEMYAALATMREEMREEGERTRRHFDVVSESLRDDIRILAEGLVAVHQRIDDLRSS